MADLHTRTQEKVTEHLASIIAMEERFKNGQVDGVSECGPYIKYDPNEASPGWIEPRHRTIWQLHQRRVKLDLVVNVVAALVKKRMGLGENENDAFECAMEMFNCWLGDGGYGPEDFIEWMDDSEWELDLPEGAKLPPLSTKVITQSPAAIGIDYFRVPPALRIKFANGTTIAVPVSEDILRSLTVHLHVAFPEAIENYHEMVKKYKKLWEEEK